MLSTCKGVAAAAGRGGAEPVRGEQSNGHGGAVGGNGTRQGPGVQEWQDGSRYEGEFVNGLKHGKGKYIWGNGEYYEGSFYKDYRHGDGLYCWPTGHKFIGKFYLNRKEGYGQHLFSDGTTFQGLYRADQRFGPGVVSYPDGCQDVGLWLGGRLLKLCAPVEESFSLKDFPEYAAYLEPATTTNSLTQPPTGDLQIKARADYKMDTDRDLLSGENFILPPGIESYSTDGDHLPLPSGRRRELDQHFYNELWEPDTYSYQGYERDPLSTLPLQARMQAHIHKHRSQAKSVGWAVAAVLSLNRAHFGSKGPLEVSSELFIQHASRGELQTVSQTLQTGRVHPDVADSQGHTALMAATMNCHNDVIHLLLDVGADIDKLNCEGMTALAMCHVLYYPFQSLHNTFTELPAKTQVSRSPSTCRNGPQVSQVDLRTDTPGLNNRLHTANTTLSSRTNQSHLSEQTAEEQRQTYLHQSSKTCTDSELITERHSGLNEPETPLDTDDLQQEKRKETGGGEGERDSKETERERQVREREEGCSWEEKKERKAEESDQMCSCDQTWENGGYEVKRKGGEFKKNLESVERRGTEQRKENMEVRVQVEEDEEKRVRNIHQDDVTERGSEDVSGVECSIQVLDGDITLGSAQWVHCLETTAGRVQQSKDKLTPHPTFDSACSVSSYNIQVTEEVMQCSAEVLSHTGFPQRSDTQETVRKMAAMKIEQRVRLKTLKLLLERGADPNVSRIPMPVLFLAIMAADAEAVRRLLLCGAHTDVPLPPKRKGLYPLHVAAALRGPAGPIITELLLHTVTDPDVRACDQKEIFEPDKILIETQKPLSTSESPHVKEGGRTALHVACERDSDYQNASKVVALLLSHRARTDLLWSGHSPLSLAIASGNDLAVEELLNGGANPNIPLGPRVGSALCALANINYRSGGNRDKLLDMLAKAGADIMVPIRVGDVVGTAVDYAHCSFNQDLRIANTPFHALNMWERETFKSRRQLLSMMGDLLRQTAGQRQLEGSQTEHLTFNTGTGAGAISSNVPLPPITKKHRKPVFKFCYHCGRSVFVKLTACSRCHKVFYCSSTCKLRSWDERHKQECIRVPVGNQGPSTQQLKLSKPKQHQPSNLLNPAAADDIQKSVVFKSQGSSRPLNAMLKSKTAPRPSGIKLKSQRVPEPLSIAEKVVESQANLKENYSCN